MSQRILIDDPLTAAGDSASSGSAASPMSHATSKKPVGLSDAAEIFVSWRMAVRRNPPPVDAFAFVAVVAAAVAVSSGVVGSPFVKFRFPANDRGEGVKRHHLPVSRAIHLRSVNLPLKAPPSSSSSASSRRKETETWSNAAFAPPPQQRPMIGGRRGVVAANRRLDPKWTSRKRKRRARGSTLGLVLEI